MELIKRAFEFEKRSMSTLVLTINEIYKKTKDPSLMDIMKRITKKKHKIDKRLKGFLAI